MKSIAVTEAASKLNAVLNTAQKERVVLTRNGKASAVVVGIESYDEEDLRLARSPEFWQMIESRRHSGSEIPLATLKRRLKAAQKKRSSRQTPASRQKRRTKAERPAP